MIFNTPAIAKMAPKTARALKTKTRKKTKKKLILKKPKKPPGHTRQRREQ